MLPWYRDESLLIAISNLVLLVLLVIVLIRNNWLASMGRRASRKVLKGQRAAKLLRYALNVTTNQYQALRRKRDRQPLIRPPKPVTRPAPVFVVPPPLDLSSPEGEDPESWVDSGIHTSLSPEQRQLAPDDTRTQPIPMLVANDLVRKTMPPEK